MLIRQLFRKPLKSLCCVLILSISVAALCVGIGQHQAMLATKVAVDDLYNTVAIPVPQTQTVQISSGGMIFQYTSKLLTQEQISSIDVLLKENSTSIKCVSDTGLASAYISELCPELYTDHDYIYGWGISSGLHSETAGAPYSCAMLEVELTEVSGRVQNYAQLYRSGYDDMGKTKDWYEEISEFYAVVLTGKIKSVIALQENYPDPTGYTAKLVLLLSDKGALEELQIGERYLVYGMDYYDLDWYNSASESNNDRFYRTISMTLKDYSALERLENQYFVPTIARLEESVTDFLKSEQGEIWNQALENIRINNQCFPVLGVDNLMYVTDFARQNALIGTGRNFTAEELETGAKVCIISESLAQANGISVGDILTLRYYNYDKDSPYQCFFMENEMAAGIQSPTAFFYTETTPFVNDGESYTVIGLYRNDGWEAARDNLYSFTPNTVFVPKTSVSGTMDYSDQGMFRTIVLKNGMISAFRRAAEEMGCGSMFVYYDQGYSEIQKELADFQAVGKRVLALGVTLSVAMLVLVSVLLVPAQKKTLLIMTDLGTPISRKLRYVLAYVIALLAPSVALGSGLCCISWNWIVDREIKAIGSAVAAVPMIEISVLMAIAVMASVVAILLNVVVYLPWICGKSHHK